MSQISSLNAFPDSDARVTSNIIKNNALGEQKSLASTNAATAAASDSAPTSSLQAQLTRLNSVLNSLQTNANATRNTRTEALQKVKSGTYEVDALHISRSIVNDSLTAR